MTIYRRRISCTHVPGFVLAMHRFIFASIVVAFLSAPAAVAQELAVPDVTYPAIVAHAGTAEAFAPQGWRVELTAQGDLNGDGRADLALVLRDTSPKNIVDSKSLGPQRFDTNPRILVIAFANRDGGYDLVLENHNLIPRPTDPQIEDVLAEAEPPAIKNGVLRLSLHLFASAGGSMTGNMTFALRYQNGKFVLIGYDSVMAQRMSGDLTKISIDYVTGKRRESTGRIDNDKDQVTWKTLPRRPLLTLEQIGDGMAFDPG